MTSETRYPQIDPSLAWLLSPATDLQPPPAVRLRKAVARHPAIMLGAVFLLAMVTIRLGLYLGAERSSPPTAGLSNERTQRLPGMIDAPFAATALRPLTSTDAIALNEAVPLSTGTNASAAPFIAPLGNAVDYQQSLVCLTQAIYYEAGNEPDEGQRAVAQVVLNRMRHVSYPHSICGVVFQGAERRDGCQFTFACDGSLRRVPVLAAWRRAQLVAAAALGGYVYTPVGLSTHYHADYVVPYWASSLDKVTTIGAHIFYRWGGAWGTRAAFTAAYAGGELSPRALAPVAIANTALDRDDTRPAEVIASQRPILMSGDAGSGTAAATQASTAKVPAAPAVGLAERWIVPHASTSTALADPTNNVRSVISDGGAVTP